MGYDQSGGIEEHLDNVFQLIDFNYEMRGSESVFSRRKDIEYRFLPKYHEIPISCSGAFIKQRFAQLY